MIQRIKNEQNPVTVQKAKGAMLWEVGKWKIFPGVVVVEMNEEDMARREAEA